MNARAYATIGTRLAEKIFRLRGRKGRKHSEVHLQEAELAAMLAIAVEEGWRRGYAAGKGDDVKADVGAAIRRERLVTCSADRRPHLLGSHQAGACLDWAPVPELE